MHLNNVQSKARRKNRGQAIIEMALLVPLMLLLALGAIDLARNIAQASIAVGVSRGGARAAVASPNIDIGPWIRTTSNWEPNTSVWGPGQSGGNGVNNYSCGTGSTSCGDPNACTAA